MTTTAATLLVTKATPPPQKKKKKKEKEAGDMERALDRKWQGPITAQMFLSHFPRAGWSTFVHLAVFCKRRMWVLWFLAALSCTVLSFKLVWSSCFVLKLLVPTRVTHCYQQCLVSFPPATTCQQHFYRKWTAADKVWVYPHAISVEHVN